MKFSRVHKNNSYLMVLPLNASNACGLLYSNYSCVSKWSRIDFWNHNLNTCDSGRFCCWWCSTVHLHYPCCRSRPAATLS